VCVTETVSNCCIVYTKCKNDGNVCL